MVLRMHNIQVIYMHTRVFVFFVPLNSMAQEFSTTFIFPVSVGRSLELGVGFCGGLLFVLLGFCGGWVVLALEMLPWLELCLEPVICCVA